MDIFSCEAGPRLTEEVLVVDERGKGGGIYDCGDARDRHRRSQFPAFLALFTFTMWSVWSHGRSMLALRQNKEINKDQKSRSKLGTTLKHEESKSPLTLCHKRAGSEVREAYREYTPRRKKGVVHHQYNFSDLSNHSTDKYKHRNCQHCSCLHARDDRCPKQ